ncbi:hypothetical protein JKY72_05445 [Candidatus Gracilibacteria bacterium]|nr:hypothetical protein [Candidatus Gracilibacteria bacterium]
MSEKIVVVAGLDSSDLNRFPIMLEGLDVEVKTALGASELLKIVSEVGDRVAAVILSLDIVELDADVFDEVEEMLGAKVSTFVFNNGSSEGLRGQAISFCAEKGVGFAEFNRPLMSAQNIKSLQDWLKSNLSAV